MCACVCVWGKRELLPPQHERMIRMEPLQTQSVCRLNVRLLYLQQRPPPPTAHLRQTRTTCSSHVQTDMFTLERLLGINFHFLLMSSRFCAFPSSFLPVQCFCFVSRPAIKARLCLHLPFLASVTSALFFISSLPLAPLWSINKWLILCVEGRGFFFWMSNDLHLWILPHNRPSVDF